MADEELSGFSDLGPDEERDFKGNQNYMGRLWKWYQSLGSLPLHPLEGGLGDTPEDQKLIDELTGAPMRKTKKKAKKGDN